MTKQPWHGITIALSVVITTMPLAGRASAAEAPPATQPTAASAVSPAMEALLKKKLPALQFDRIGLGDVLDFFRDAAGANLYIGWPALEAVGLDRSLPISVEMNDVPVERALAEILARADGGRKLVSFTTRDNTIIVSANKALAALERTFAQHDAKPVADPKLRKLLETRVPEVNFGTIELSDALDYLRDVTGTKISVAWQSLEAAGVAKTAAVELRLRDARLGDVLSLLLTAVPAKRPLHYTTQGGGVTIAAAPADAPPRAKP